MSIDMNEDNLRRLLNTVVDEDSFVRFLSALGADHAEEVERDKRNPPSPDAPGSNGWENGAVHAFLEGASAWAEASRSGLSTYRKPENPWKRCADILYMGKIYE